MNTPKILATRCRSRAPDHLRSSPCGFRYFGVDLWTISDHLRTFGRPTRRFLDSGLTRLPRLLSSLKFRGPTCASGHSASLASWLCFEAQRSFSIQTSARSGHTHFYNVQKLVFWLCLETYCKLARLAREGFLGCALIHWAKMAGWPGLARIKTMTRRAFQGLKTQKALEPLGPLKPLRP